MSHIEGVKIEKLSQLNKIIGVLLEGKNLIEKNPGHPANVVVEEVIKLQEKLIEQGFVDVFSDEVEIVCIIIDFMDKGEIEPINRIFGALIAGEDKGDFKGACEKIALEHKKILDEDFAYQSFKCIANNLVKSKRESLDSLSQEEFNDVFNSTVKEAVKEALRQTDKHPAVKVMAEVVELLLEENRILKDTLAEVKKSLYSEMEEDTVDCDNTDCDKCCKCDDDDSDLINFLGVDIARVGNVPKGLGDRQEFFPRGKYASTLDLEEKEALKTLEKNSELLNYNSAPQHVKDRVDSLCEKFGLQPEAVEIRSATVDKNDSRFKAMFK